MLETSFGLLFFLKSSKSTQDNKRHLYARITVNGIAKEFSTKQVWYTDRWNQNAGRASDNKEDARTINNHIDLLTSKIYQAKKSLMERDEEISADRIYRIIHGKAEDKKMVLEIFKEHNTKMEHLEGIDYAPGTIKRYATSFDHTKSFIKWKYKSEDFELAKLNYEFISEYEYWLKTVRKCNHNTTMKYLANFKKIVLYCVHLGWLPKDPFFGFKLAKKEVIRGYLTSSELELLVKKDFKVDRLNLIRDIFVFSCYTGLAYIDVYNLRQSQIIKGVDGEFWITYNRQKTQTPTRVPLLPQAVAIVDRYQDHPRCLSSGCVLPIMMNQKTNAYLKEIATLCGISKELTFHIARHTFATTVTLSNGVPIETVSKMLGHRTLKQTQHYAKIVDTKISQDMQVLKAKLSANENA